MDRLMLGLANNNIEEKYLSVARQKYDPISKCFLFQYLKKFTAAQVHVQNEYKVVSQSLE